MIAADLEEIKRWLQRGDIKEVAEKTGYSQTYASQVLKGKHSNHDLIEAMIDRAVERKARVTGKMEKLKTL